MEDGYEYFEDMLPSDGDMMELQPAEPEVNSEDELGYSSIKSGEEEVPTHKKRTKAVLPGQKVSKPKLDTDKSKKRKANPPQLTDSEIKAFWKGKTKAQIQQLLDIEKVPATV
jgi:hypothetical protein